MTKERAILFGAPMVRAILDGRKTQTRRGMSERHRYHFIEASGDLTLCPYGKPGDRLYVREIWAKPTTLDPGPTFYRTDYPDNVLGKYEIAPAFRWLTLGGAILSRVLLAVRGLAAFFRSHAHPHGSVRCRRQHRARTHNLWDCTHTDRHDAFSSRPDRASAPGPRQRAARRA